MFKLILSFEMQVSLSPRLPFFRVFIFHLPLWNVGFGATSLLCWFTDRWMTSGFMSSSTHSCCCGRPRCVWSSARVACLTSAPPACCRASWATAPCCTRCSWWGTDTSVLRDPRSRTSPPDPAVSRHAPSSARGRCTLPFKSSGSLRNVLIF